MGNADDDPVRQVWLRVLRGPVAMSQVSQTLVRTLLANGWNSLRRLFRKLREWQFFTSSGETAMSHVRETRVVAPALNVQLQSVAVQDAEFLEKAFQIAKSGRAEALIVVHVGLCLI